MAIWTAYEARHRFREIFERARTEGPQVITLHGKDQAVLLSIETYRRLQATKPDFKEYLLSGPKVNDFEIDRPRDLGREADI